MDMIKENEKSIKAIDLVLENCEVIRVPQAAIKDLKFNMTYCDESRIELKDLHLEIDQNASLIDLSKFKGYSSRGCIKRLLECNDITHVTLIEDINDETTYINTVVFWEDDCKLENDNQKSYIDENGTYILDIKKQAEYIKEKFEEVKKEKSYFYNIYLEKCLILDYLEATKTEILKKNTNKTASNIGALNLVSRVLMDIKSGKFDKVVF